QSRRDFFRQDVAQELLGFFLLLREIGRALLHAVFEHFVGVLETAERTREAPGHVVERARERAELVVALRERHLFAETLLAELLGRERELSHGPREEARCEIDEDEHRRVRHEHGSDDVALRLALYALDVARLEVAAEERHDLAGVIA